MRAKAEQDKNTPSVEAGGGAGIEGRPPRRSFEELMSTPAEILCPWLVRPVWNLRALSNHWVRGAVARAGEVYAASDEEEGIRAIAYGNAAAEGWVPDPERVRDEARKALAQLVALRTDDDIERMAEHMKAQIRRVAAIVEGK